MKIKVCKLKPNPYRNMAKYPIDREKIEALKTSIQETSFWDNIIARKKNGHYEIAYGHHRWLAIQELGFKEVNIPVRSLSDAMMIKIMAEENLNWATTPAVINETIRAAKAFLDTELHKYKTLKEMEMAPIYRRHLFANQKAFANAKRKDTDGVGWSTLLAFLGGNWKKWVIVEALAVLGSERQGKVDRKAVERIPNITKAREFHRCIKAYSTPKPKQAAVAEHIREKDTPTEQIRMVVARASQTKKRNDKVLGELEKLVTEIDNGARLLVKKVRELRRLMEYLNVEELKGVKAWLAACSVRHLYTELERMKNEH